MKSATLGIAYSLEQVPVGMCALDWSLSTALLISESSNSSEWKPLYQHIVLLKVSITFFKKDPHLCTPKLSFFIQGIAPYILMKISQKELLSVRPPPSNRDGIILVASEMELGYYHFAAAAATEYLQDWNASRYLALQVMLAEALRWGLG